MQRGSAGSSAPSPFTPAEVGQAVLLYDPAKELMTKARLMAQGPAAIWPQMEPLMLAQPCSETKEERKEGRRERRREGSWISPPSHRPLVAF